MGAQLDIDDVTAGHPVAEAELAELRSKAKRLEAAERDAARWRYLRKEVISASWLINGGSIVKTLDDSCDPSAFDKAIDAAMQESGE